MNDSHKLLLEADSWLPSVLEDRFSEVVEAASVVLAGSDTSPVRTREAGLPQTDRREGGGVRCSL